MLVKALLLLGLVAFACAMPERDGDGRQEPRRRAGSRLRRRFHCPADATRAECVQMVQDLIQRLRDAGQRPFARRPGKNASNDTNTNTTDVQFGGHHDGILDSESDSDSDSSQTTNTDHQNPGRRGRGRGKKGGRRDRVEKPTQSAEVDQASSGEGSDEQSPPENRRDGQGRGRGRGCGGRRRRQQGNATDEPPTEGASEPSTPDADGEEDDCQERDERRGGRGEGRRGQDDRRGRPGGRRGGQDGRRGGQDGRRGGQDGRRGGQGGRRGGHDGEGGRRDGRGRVGDRRGDGRRGRNPWTESPTTDENITTEAV